MVTGCISSLSVVFDTKIIKIQNTLVCLNSVMASVMEFLKFPIFCNRFEVGDPSILEDPR